MLLFTGFLVNSGSRAAFGDETVGLSNICYTDCRYS